MGFKSIFSGLIEWELVQKRRGFPAGCGWWVELRAVVGKQENEIKFGLKEML